MRLFLSAKDRAESMARGFRAKVPQNVLVDDLIGAAHEGLYGAALRFDGPEDRFKYFALVRIRGAIVDFLRRQDYISRRQRAMSGEINRLTSDDPDMTTEQVAERLKISPLEVGRLKAVRVLGFDDIGDTEGGRSDWVDRYAYSGQDPEQILLEKEKRMFAKSLLEKLKLEGPGNNESSRLRLHRICWRIFVDGKRHKEVADEFGISEPRVSQLVTKAKAYLSKIVDEQP